MSKNTIQLVKVIKINIKISSILLKTNTDILKIST